MNKKTIRELLEHAQAFGLVIDGVTYDSETCVACGEKFDVLHVRDGEEAVYFHNHHCNPRREASIEAHRRIHDQQRLRRRMSLHDRLAYGNALLEEDDPQD